MQMDDMNNMTPNQTTVVSMPMPSKTVLDGLFNEAPIPLHDIREFVPMDVAIYDSQEKFTVWGMLNGLVPLEWEGRFRFNGDISNNLDLKDALEILLAKYTSLINAKWPDETPCRSASNRAAIVTEIKEPRRIRYVGVAIRWEK